MGAILNLFSLIKMLIELWNAFQAHEAAMKEAEALKRSQERDRAIDDLAKVKTPEDAYADQTSIVNAEP